MKVVEKFSEIGRRHQALEAMHLQFSKNLPQKDWVARILELFSYGLLPTRALGFMRKVKDCGGL